LKEVICNDRRPTFKELIDIDKFRQFDVEFDGNLAHLQPYLPYATYTDFYADSE
jgi:hypothetical protein